MLVTILSGGLVGIVFGFVLQRTRFCMTGGFRDMYIAKNYTLFNAFIIAITVESIGVISLWKLGYISNPYEEYSVLGTLLGSYLFGIGIVLAGGCATGTWYRAGEGLIGSWVALIFYMLSAASMKYGALKGLNQLLTQNWVINDNLPKSLGISVWYFVALLTIISILIVLKELKSPKTEIAKLPPRYSGLRYLLFERTYHKYWAGFTIGIIALIAWPASEFTGRVGGLGITTPSANLITYITTGDARLLNWGVYLVLGIFLGSFIAAKGAGEFRWRIPDVPTLLKSSIGGLLMGVGASWAGGCTIGNGLTATAVISSKGWIALPVTILGVWTASYFIFVRPSQK
ncbi:YeeE/YedE family protein [Streptococcus loxodontisalivarius]|uniref:Membrane protein YedE/YeeE n=1 Tax=Streptococcus loxodontisalivarius TaxID=1349415 RepID=A0ABS2PU12_9STRE|nr:YeeE/YedE family protein [Streptococcus loxodontisalivarius]MBM7643548.1 putative membrane protein YedE/YeeE [Streptococcus loxodontisalivarius]